MAITCPNVPAMQQDPRFKKLAELYKDRGLPDYVLAVSIVNCIQRNDLDNDWWPENGDDIKLFTDYLNTTFDNFQNKKLSEEYLQKLFDTMRTLYSSPKVLDRRLGQINNWFSSRVDKLMKSSDKSLSRQQVIAAQAKDGKNGFQAIMEDVFKMIESLSTLEGQKSVWQKQNPSYGDEQWEAVKDFWQYRADEFKKMSDNKDALFALAAPKIGAIEGFAVTMDGAIVNTDINNEPDYEDDAESEEDNTIDTTEAQKGDRYVDFRTLSLMSTLSTEAKTLISGLRVMNVDGKYETDDLGYTIPLDIRQTAITLHKVLRYSEPKTMMDDLRNAVSKYPNLRDLVNHLKNNPDDAGIIYSNFKKAKSIYYYGYIDENGALQLRSSGNKADGYNLSKEAGSNLSLGSVPQNEYSIVDTAGNLTSDTDKISKLYHNALNLSYEDYPKYLRGLGFDISDDEFKAVFPIGTKTLSDGRQFPEYPEELQEIENSLYEIYDKAEFIVKSGDDVTGSHLYQYAQNAFTEIAELLSPLQKGEVEERVISGSKSLASNTNPNALHRLVDNISNARHLSQQEYTDQMMQDYGQYEGMGLGFGEDTKLTGWLEHASNQYVINNSGDKQYWKPEWFQVVDMTDSMKTDYGKLTDLQHMTNSYVMFVRGGKNRIDNCPENGSFYEIPIQSDYETAYNFIFAPRYDYRTLVERLTEEVEVEAQRIAAIKERIANDNASNSAELTRAKIITNERRGVEFIIFPELNTNGFIDRYANASNPAEAENIVREAVDEQLRKHLATELQKVISVGLNTKANKQRIGASADNKSIAGWEGEFTHRLGIGEENRNVPLGERAFLQDVKLDGINTNFGDSVASWILNSFYARWQVTKLMYGGVQNFSNTSDFEKRNMYSHATMIPLYTEATYHGEKVGKENQRVLYLADDEVKSSIYDKISTIADRLVSEHKITPDQRKRMVNAFSSITTTDGQGVRTLDSMRSVKIMANLWTEADEKAYKNIKNKKYTPENVEHFMVGLKPIYTGYEIIPAQPGQYQKPQRIPVLHKYSEMVLLPEIMEGISLQNDTVPFKAFNRINDKLGKGNEIDLFLFGSCVKVGGHSLIDAFAKDDNGNRILKDADSISNFVVNKINSGNFWVHTLPFKYYGIASSVHADIVDKNIAWASQAEKEAWANILPDEMITVAGKQMRAEDGRELYNQIKAAKTIDAFDNVRRLLQSNRELAKLLKEELSSRPYQSRDMLFQLQMLEAKGGFGNWPLCQPSLQHDIVALMSSIIKKRLTKSPVKGANILQTSGFGLDMDASSFDNKNAIKESDKLEVKFDKNGKLKYVEAFIPIHDSRLIEFADENGNISPERLNKLISDKIIPDGILNFITYRTPSDAEHSIIPCRIKGFISNSAGASIRLPKEVMPMTGHDYDGDKMRCHFKDFSIGWNEDKIHEDYVRYYDNDAMKAILSDTDNADMLSYEAFRRNIVSGQIGDNSKYRAIKSIDYDYSKSPSENIEHSEIKLDIPKEKAEQINDRNKQIRSDYRKLNNALVDLMFAQLTSDSGSLKMFIPGGNAETTVYARTMQAMRAFGSEEGRRALRDGMKAANISQERIQEITSNENKLYNFLVKQNDKTLSTIVSSIELNDSPFSVSHATYSHGYMMEGANMIGVYAVYNSAAAVFQRLNLSYIPAQDKDGNLINVSFFGKPISTLFNVISNDTYSTLGMARLVNAAVDNGKNPILGHLNQTQALAPITNFLFSSGYSEEEVHLILNQPIMIELAKRMKDPKSPGLNESIDNLVREITNNNRKKYSQIRSVAAVASTPRETFIKNLPKSYQQIAAENGSDLDNQVNLILTIQHISTAANDLDQFTKLTRPESNSGGIDSTLGGTVAKIIQLDEFRERVQSGEARIAGMEDVIDLRKVYVNTQTQNQMMKTIGDTLPEIVAMNTMLKDSLPTLMRYFFPQTREAWMRIAKRIASKYTYKRIPGNVVERIENDMFLWKLMSDPLIVSGNPQEEQERILKEVPEQLRKLKEKLFAASSNENDNSIPRGLIDNVFLNNLELGTTLNEENETVRRIRFKLNGPSVEDTADAIKAGWDQLLRYEGTKQLAIDLFKYNLYTNGFSYGRYEFYHYAPFSVMLSMKNFTKALWNVLDKSTWEQNEEEQFYHQYCMNHWGDKNFLVRLSVDELPMNIRASIGIETPSNKSIPNDEFNKSIAGLDYIVVQTSKKEDKLYRIVRNSLGIISGIEEAQKLGLRNRNNQVMVQYNPKVRDYREVKPYFKSNDVSWETKRARMEDTSNIDEEARMAAIDDIPFDISLMPTGMQQNSGSSVSNDGKLTAEQAAAFGFEDEDTDAQTINWARYSDNGYEVSSAGDARFSAKNAKFKEGTIIFGHDVSGRTIESVYQHGVKQGDWLTDNNSKTGAPRNNDIIKGNTEDSSYENGYLPLWKEWARQNPKLVEELRTKSKGKVLTDKFASTRVSQARALADILNSKESYTEDELSQIKEKAIADGTFMKAPNGNPTNLTEKQWLQVRTKAFKDWFGDWENDSKKASKVVDENGEPLVVYTGVPVKGITEFRFDTDNRASLTPILKKGIYFSDKNTAALYTKGKPVYKTTNKVNAEQARRIDIWYWSGDVFDNNAAEYIGLPISTIREYIDNHTNDVTGELDASIIPEGEVVAAFLNIKNPVYTDVHGETIQYLSKSDVDKINNSEGAIIEHVDEHTTDSLIPTDSTDYIVFSANQIKSATDNFGEFSKNNNDIYFSIVHRDQANNVITEKRHATPETVTEARRQRAFVELNKRLREILRKHGVSVGVLDESERALGAAGVSDFSTAKVFSEGLKELIRIANGIEGEYALPEEFAHVALEMLGKRSVTKDEDGNIIAFTHENPLVQRLLNTLNNDDKALEEAYDGMLGEYEERYGRDNREKLVVEAAGKLVAKQLFQHQMTETRSVKGLISRIIEAIKNFFRKFSVREIEDAEFGADNIASQLARDLLSGRLADEMSLDKITSSESFFKVENDLSDKEDLLSKMMKTTAKQVDVLSRRLKHAVAKGGSSASLDATKKQLEKLQAAVDNQKLETTVVDYMKDAMSFMKEMEASLDTTINNRPANAVCKKLRIVKDTMFSFANVVEDIRKAIDSKELQDDIDVKSTLKDLSYQMEEFWQKYNRISLMYFEQFLENIYGKEGVTITVGRNKGKRVTIHEMATKANKDISTLSRLLNAVSDIDDYVLQAIDSTTRDAKLNARARVRALRPKLEAAMAAVIKEQGNRDQTWMFEYKMENGKKVRTGRYISKEEAEKLSDAKKNFYKVFMELKHEADSCVPDLMTSERKMIMFRKEHYERMKEAQGVKGAAQEEWEAAKRSVLEMGDIDFENEEVIVDFEGNKVDQLPLKFLNKGKNETYDDMTEDAATSLMAYLGMALEYRELSNVIGVLENARYMASRRDVAQKRNSRNRIENIGDEEDIHFRKPFTVKQARTNLQQAIDDFYQMHVYGHLRKDEGTIGNTRISKRKAADTLNRFSSLSQMAVNLHQRIANINTGFTQIIVESLGGKIKAKDVAWAAGIWTKESADRLAETGKTDYSNKLSLWMDKFDIHQDNGQEAQLTKYGRKRSSRVFNEGLLYAGMTVGEDFLAGTTALALARQVKLKGPNDEESNIWDAYTVKYVDDKNKTGAYLALKDGYTKADGTAFTFEDEKKFAKEVIGTNFELQGIYNTDDRSAIQQHALGALAIMYRKWIAPALKRRYAGVQYSNLKGGFTEGYYSTAARLVTDTVKDWFSPVSKEDSEKTIMQILTDIDALKSSIALNWSKMNDYERGNIKKALTEMSIVFGLFVTSALLSKLPPDDHDGNKLLAWADDVAVTQVLRLRSEIGSQAPTPNLINEGMRILSSPFAALRPLKDSLNIFQLMWAPNYFETVKSGRYKDRTKAYKYFRSLPIISMFRKLDNFVDPSPLIEYYKNQNY